MAEYLRKRIEELKSRKAAIDDRVINLQPTATTTALAAAVSATTTVSGTISPPPFSSSTVANKTVTSVPIANLPPSFVSPHAAMVKYRDAVTDPLCARFTTKHAVALLESMLGSYISETRRKRERSSDMENSTDGNSMEQEPQERRLRGEGGEEKDQFSEGNVFDNMTGKGNNPIIDSSLDAVISYFLPNLAAKCFSSNEEQMGKDEFAHINTHLFYQNRNFGSGSGNISSNNKKGYIMVSGKRRLPCRSVNEYVPKARIAHGVYGVVFSATESPHKATHSVQGTGRTGRKFALKQVKKQWLVESQVGFPPYLLREFDLLLRLRHPNIVKALEVVILDRKYEATRQLRTCGGSENNSVSSRDSNGEYLRDVTGSEQNGNITTAPTQKKTNVDGVQRQVRGTDHVKDVYLVMEYCPYDLKSFLTLHNDKGVYLHLSSCNTHPNARLNFLSRVKCIMQQLFQGLFFLHEHRILHRDIKTSNILISHEGIVKFCDFGLGRLYSEGQVLTGNVVTLMYRAPELHFGVRDYSHKMDVWSLGCIMAELFLKMPLFRAEEEVKHFAVMCDILGIPTEETFSGLYKMPELVRMMRSLTKYNRKNTLCSVFEKSRHAGASTLPASGLDLLQKIFQWNPIDRPSAREALNHPFFHEEPLPCEPAELMRPMPTSEATSGRHVELTSTRRSQSEAVGATPPPQTQIVGVDDSHHTTRKPTLLSETAPTAMNKSHNRHKDGDVMERDAETSSSEDDAKRTLMQELQSLKDVPSPGDGDEAQRVAIQARLRANQDRDSLSSPEY